MPRISRKRKLEDDAIATADPTLIIESKPGEEEWRLSFDPMDPNIPFLDALNCMTQRDWLRHILYLYRVLPEVRNKAGQDKYIARITDPTSEEINGEWLEWVAREQGGGKFYFLMKDDLKPTPRTRTHIFSIDGAPRFQAGQTLAEQPQALLPATAHTFTDSHNSPPTNGGGSDMREVTSLLRDVVKNRPGDMGVEQAVDLMGKVQEASVKVMQRAAEFQVTSSTGSALVDRMMEKMLDANFAAKSQPQIDPRLNRILDLAIERMANPEPPPRGTSIGDLNNVKDLFGADSIADVFQRFAGGADDGAWKAKLVDAGIGLIATLPQLFSMVAQQREREFQQRVYLAQLQSRQPAPPPANQPAQVAPRTVVQFPPPPPPPATPITEPSAMPATGGAPAATAAADTPPAVPGALVMPFPVFDPFDGWHDPFPLNGEIVEPRPTRAALDAIVDYFDEGMDGGLAARLVQKHHPNIVLGLKPLMADVKVVLEFAQRTPPLSDIAGETEFPQFLQEFCKEVLQPSTENLAEKPEPVA